jgi:hypothetical protein
MLLFLLLDVDNQKKKVEKKLNGDNNISSRRQENWKRGRREIQLDEMK